MECAFVGTGSVAETYAAGLEDSPLELTAACDLREDRVVPFARSHDATPYTDVDALLEGESVPLVLNLTSHGAHADVTGRCLGADRHVFSEKPLAMDGERARRLVRTADRRGLALGCAPINHRGTAQRHVRSLLADGRFGTVRLGYAYAHVGRVTEWHDDPDSFLAVGPLYDGAVYPLNLLVSWFGPAARVRTADGISAWPDREEWASDRSPHVTTTIEFAEGPVIELDASMYVPHRSREFYGLELHGDAGSVYLRDAGGLRAADDSVRVAGLGREYTSAPVPRPPRDRSYLEGPERLAAAVRAGKAPTSGARRSAHVVTILNAIETAIVEGGPVEMGSFGIQAPSFDPPPIRPPRSTQSDPRIGDPREGAIRLPPIGFGCSRYRDGEYVDRIESIATALDAGYRLFDSAELYGNEGRIGTLLAAPGTPSRESLFVTGKVWNTNHEHVAEACEGSLAELGIDAFDCYMLHWPESWAYQGPLRNLAEQSPATQEALTVPTDEKGNPAVVDVPLTETWERLEVLHDRSHTRTLGVCNVSPDQLLTITESARIQPAVVQVECHPYTPRRELVELCHDRGIRVMAHSPLSAPGLLAEPVLQDIGTTHGVSPAVVVLAWNVSRGVVPIPSSIDRTHIVENLAAAGLELDESDRDRIDSLADPSFER